MFYNNYSENKKKKTNFLENYISFKSFLFDIDATLPNDIEIYTNSEYKSTKHSKIIDDDNFTPNDNPEISVTTINPDLLINTDSDTDSTYDDAITTISFSFISKTKIAIEFTYSINDNIKQLLIKNGGVYEQSLRLWIAPFHKYTSLYKDMKEYKKQYIIKPIPSFVIKAIQTENFNKIIFTLKHKEIIYNYINDPYKTINDLPKAFYNALYEFQKTGIEFGIKHHGRVLIADEMGIGKTIQAIGLCYIYKSDWPVIIICPGSVKYNWSNEIQKWLSIKKEDIYLINKSKCKIPKDKSFYIISYDLVYSVRDKIKSLKSNIYILDECHNIKNPLTQRASCLVPMSQKSKRLLLLSGTPILSYTKEAFSLLQSLRPDIFTNFQEYKMRYCSNDNSKVKKSSNGASNTKELNCIFNTLMIRRLKKDVLNQLPPKRRTKIEIECEQKAIRMLKNKKTQQDKPMSIGEAYKLTGKSKIVGIKKYIEDLLMEKIKFILFAHHKEVLDSIEGMIKNKMIKYIRIDGNVDTQKRFKLVEEFQTNENCLVALLSINASATGITLTSASMVVFGELAWTPSIMIQAEDRAHRIGQRGNFVDVRYLYGRDTLDEYIFKKLSEKMTIVSTTLDNVKVDLGLKEDGKKESEKERDDENNEDLETVSTEMEIYDENLHNVPMKRRKNESDKEINQKSDNILLKEKIRVFGI